ncbi:MAG TPA: hypothetical protein VIQ00_14230 [Chitinophagaceae bacterium]
MRWLLFLSRLAFICNIFFLLSASLQVYDWAANNDFNGTIIIIGYFMALLLNPLVNLTCLVILVIRKKLPDVLPTWLPLANLVFLIMQLLFIIYLTANKTI